MREVPAMGDAKRFAYGGIGRREAGKYIPPSCQVNQEVPRSLDFTSSPLVLFAASTCHFPASLGVSPRAATDAERRQMDLDIHRHRIRRRLPTFPNFGAPRPNSSHPNN